jgi:hypothetical protein
MRFGLANTAAGNTYQSCFAHAPLIWSTSKSSDQNRGFKNFLIVYNRIIKLVPTNPNSHNFIPSMTYKV